MKLKALIFDVDGTIANTEQEGHWPACNEAFTQLNYAIQWTWDEYKQLLSMSGTQNRVRHAFTAAYPNWAKSDLDEAVTEFMAAKREIYLQKYAAVVVLRPGIKELVAEAVAQNIKLAIVTLSHEEQVIAMLKKQMPEFAGAFQLILGKEAGPKHAPGSPLYTRCLRELMLSPDEVVVIEDSKGGTAAAIEAGLSVVVTYNEITENGYDFVMKNLTWDILLPKYIEFYKKLIK